MLYCIGSNLFYQKQEYMILIEVEKKGGKIEILKLMFTHLQINNMYYFICF
jgi:hypothetical protein